MRITITFHVSNLIHCVVFCVKLTAGILQIMADLLLEPPPSATCIISTSRLNEQFRTVGKLKYDTEVSSRWRLPGSPVTFQTDGSLRSLTSECN